MARDALRQHRKGQAAERLKAGPMWEDNDLVFANEAGRPMDAGNLLRRSFWPILEKAGLPRIRFHDLRHFAATLLLSQGINHAEGGERGDGRSAQGIDLISRYLTAPQRLHIITVVPGSALPRLLPGLNSVHKLFQVTERIVSY